MSTSIDQVARLLSEIPYIEARPGVTVAEVAAVFGVSQAQVRKDISVAIFCGLPGGYPSDLIDVDLDVMADEGEVYLTNPTSLDRPLRLTVTEAASLQLALMAVRPLVRPQTVAAIDTLLAKVAQPTAPSVDLRLSAGDETIRQTVNQAIAQAERLDLTYEGQARGTTTHPVVDPVSIDVRDGVAYLVAYDLAAGWRRYRLDRVTAAVLTGVAADHHGPRPDPDDWARSLAVGDTARLTVSPGAAWIAEFYPVRRVHQIAHGVEVDLSVVDPAWLVRLLLSLGDQVLAVEPASYAQAAADLARQALLGYE